MVCHNNHGTALSRLMLSQICQSFTTSDILYEQHIVDGQNLELRTRFSGDGRLTGSGIRGWPDRVPSNCLKSH